MVIVMIAIMMMMATDVNYGQISVGRKVVQCGRESVASVETETTE